MSVKYYPKKEILSAAAGFLLSCFIVWWYLFLNPYVSLFYREQSGMFLFSRDYFLKYLLLPGGLTEYASSFLVQFFRYRALGALIYLGIFWTFYAVFNHVSVKFSLFKDSFFVAFIPGLLFLPASINMLFDPADELAVIIALYGFIALTKVAPKRFYYLYIPPVITVLYILIGGNVLLGLTLFILYLLFKKPEKYLLQIVTGILSLAIPVILWYFFYMVSFKSACFALTHFRYPDAQLFDSRGIARLSVVVIPFIGMLLKKIKTGKKPVFIGNIGLAIILLTVIVKLNRSDFENIVRMGFDAENLQWKDILETNKKTSVSPLSCYYTNFALQKTGQMPEKMFQYDQIGVSGLFPDLKDHFSCSAESELFYQLGLINHAQHSAYESMIGYSYIKEPNIRNLKRLSDCAIIRQDSALSAKYEKILNKTLFYGNYAKNRNERSNDAAPFKMKNTLSGDMSVVLESILEYNSNNKAIFEYLMAYYLLERDYEKAKNCFDRYFRNFSYPQIPTHYAEFLALYKRLKQLDDSFYEQYPISRDIRERFDMMDILVSAEPDDLIQKALEDGFKHTYWFYVKFPLVNVETLKEDEKNIY